MYFEFNKSILYSDTLVPDIFISEYMPSLDGDYLKIYIYCLFLGKHGKQATAEDLSKKLNIDINRVKDGLIHLEGLGIITRTNEGIMLADLKEKEINKMFRPKTTSSPEEAALSMERNKKRNKIISAINKNFFQGVMSPSWYTDIDAWFDRYQFEEDVMYVLFQHCYDHNCLNKNYIAKVAESWYNKNIRNSFDLDKYFITYQKMKDISGKIIKKLKLNRNLTEYEEEYVEKWVFDYKFDFGVIELALKKTASKTNPNVKYVNAILTDWYEKGFKTKEDVLNFEKSQKTGAVQDKVQTSKVPQRSNFKQREYDDNYYDSLYENVGGEK